MSYDPVLARTMMARTPAVLRAWLEGLPPEWVDAPEAPGAWSPRDVACHMADLEADGWLPRVRAILEHGEARPLRGIERERFRRRFTGAPLQAVLDSFAEHRASNLVDLDAMELDARRLAATGRHPELGRVTVAQLLSTWTVHDLTHLAQIARALAARHRDAVGPWRAYLSVLRPPGPA